MKKIINNTIVILGFISSIITIFEFIIKIYNVIIKNKKP